MKRTNRMLAFALVLVMCFPAIRASAQREKVNIDFDWYFHLGDLTNGESQQTEYKDWRLLDVPHDWSIEGKFNQENPGGKANAFLPGGIGWYKKEIDWDPAWQGRRVAVEFDGIFMNSTVWLNGELLGYRPNGYLGINYDLTPYLRSGRNVLTVKVDNSLQPAARWYSGSGIYRHVWLIVTDPVHVIRDGVYVTTPEVSASSAQVRVEAQLANLSGAPTQVSVTSVITDAQGNEVARGKSQTVDLPDNTLVEKRMTVNDEVTVRQPALWSPDSPTVYYLRTEVAQQGKVVDVYTTRFGIRKAEFAAPDGFRLNGVPMKFKGVCMHQNMGVVGSAVPLDLWHKRLAMLKEMGCNAVRTSHYAYPPEFYAMCDTMGLMVMDELFDGWYQWNGSKKAKNDYGRYFLDWWEQDLADFIRRDRNHPCVMIWSMGNEVWGYDRHLYLQYCINKMFHTLDPTRPTTQAWALTEYLDIAGFNANGEGVGDLAKFRKEQPQKLAIGTEIPHTRQTRGVYRTKSSFNAYDTPPAWIKKGLPDNIFPIPDLTEEEVFPEFDMRYASGYDNQTRKITVREQWKQTRDNDFFIGEFRWTAFDYLGESWGWPARTNNYGVIDLACFPKDSYYLYQSLWSDRPMVHLLPHWTWPGKEGVEIPVVVYTNGDEAELFQDGRSLGRQKMDPSELQIVWKVPYKAGTLTAVAYKAGKEIARKSTTTAGKPASIKLTADRQSIKANRTDVVCVTADILDSRGRFVPYASDSIRFEVSGPYKLLGVENGDILDQSSCKISSRKAFMGKVLLMLQATEETGNLTIKAYADGLKSGRISVKVEENK